MVWLKPAIRTSTLATFEVVITLPEMVSPECTSLAPIFTKRISGAALGGRTTSAGFGLFAGTGRGVGEAIATSGERVGAADGRGGTARFVTRTA